jgi:predicted MFS family arabinose efflux permease
MLAATMERACFAAMAVYLAPFLLSSYRIDMRVLAGALALVAAGNLIGNVVGAWLADRLPARPLTFAAASAATGVLVLPLMLWQPGLGPSVGLAFGYSLANAIGRPALMATLSEVPSEVRGSVLGLNITVSSLGWLGAITLGGWLIDHHGFASLGALGALVALGGSTFAVLPWRAPRPMPRPRRWRRDDARPRRAYARGGPAPACSQAAISSCAMRSPLRAQGMPP